MGVRSVLRLGAVSIGVLAATASATAVMAQGIAGDYLAGRQAQYLNDFDAVGTYYGKAYRQDPSNVLLLERTLLGYINRGDFDRAVSLVSKIAPAVPDNQIARMAILGDLLEQGKHAEVIEKIDAGKGIGPLIDILLVAWSRLDADGSQESFEAFEAIVSDPASAAFGSYHYALARALVGDFEGAKDLILSEPARPLTRTRRGSIVTAQILSQLGENESAAQVITGLHGQNLDLEMRNLLNSLTAGETVPFTGLSSVSDGAAEVFYSVAAALEAESDEDYTLIFSRTAEHIRSDYVDAILLSAELLERLDAYNLATETYDRVPREHPAFHAAEIGRAEALYNAGENETAVEVLRQLTESHADEAEVHRVLGDVLRRLKRFDEASSAYDAALATSHSEDRGLWFTYYARGITFERTDQWVKAEADFRKALELNPGQPNVLNYLGYSLLEKGIKLDEALMLIEEAVAARPDSGYIVDSLGWALFQMERYDEAIVHMERAAELQPVDPVINDHLGDALWKVGRFVEARFHWTRAMSLDPEEKDAERITRKLELGLDIVLEEEANPTVKVAKDLEGLTKTEDDG